MAYRETMENNGMEAGRAKNQIPYCTVVLVALNVILFLIGLILPKAGEWNRRAASAWCIFSMSTAGFID